ncbi:hypothetical protein B0H11DRAFT_2021901 [Mycena galericulata]|nr:hypothetical protein B0H11DRAFT_2021901 [Mycena galericulata]
MPTPKPLAPSSTSASDASELLGIARLLQAKIKDLEGTIAERKARRQEWRAGVARLDKKLVALRAQDAKEGEKLAKLSARWNRATLEANRYGLDSGAGGRYQVFGFPQYLGSQEDRFVCPTTQAASAFNGLSERYQDSYIFSGLGPAWQTAATSTPALAFSSPPWSPRPVYDGFYDNEDSKFRFTVSPDGFDISSTGSSREGAGSFMRGQGQDTPPTPTPKRTNSKHAGLRAALADIRNIDVAQGFGGVSDGRKRKSADFEADGYEGPYKRMREEVVGKRQSYVRDERSTRRDSRRNSTRRNSGMGY